MIIGTLHADMEGPLRIKVESTTTRESIRCFHCGNECDAVTTHYDDKEFCCEGCKNVYSILKDNNMCQYYSIDTNPGISKKSAQQLQFDFLDNPEVEEKLIHFKNDQQTRISFYIPSIHCASCIWLLENLQKIHPGILQSEVNFPQKKVYIIYQHTQLRLKQLAFLLTDLGYAPDITYNDLDRKKKKASPADRNFIYKLGIAGFCFGNIMLFSFPEYLHLNQLVDPGFKPFFGYLNLLLSLPVLLYSASGYFISAWNGLKNKFINIDVPLALGITVMFIRSSYEIISGSGAGFMDALAGLVFFLLIGKWFQNKTYDSLSFDRDYKSYLPVSIGKIIDNQVIQVSLDEIKMGDSIEVKDGELIPVDGYIIQGMGSIDYSFVTGESAVIEKKTGDKLYAGGKQEGGTIRVKVTKPVSQSYLTQLWNQEVFSKPQPFKTISSRVSYVSKYFTIAILMIAALTGIYWAMVDPSKIINATTSILIITCPCALALTLPFTFGNALRILNRNSLYLKNSISIENMANINTIVFDKTGTITTPRSSQVEYIGNPITIDEYGVIKKILHSSNHPLSRALYDHISFSESTRYVNIRQIAGKGIIGSEGNDVYKIGSASFVNLPLPAEDSDKKSSSRVYIEKNGALVGYYTIKNQYREGLEKLVQGLKHNYELHILSGDNDGEKENLIKIFGQDVNINFYQQPIDKLNYIHHLQEKGKKVLMVGDGLNDAGALKQSEVGISVTEGSNNFFPACDGMLKAESLPKLDKILRFSKLCMNVMKYSFFISLAYNLVGLSFAVRGELLPVMAAIIMPLSSVSVVGFTVLASSMLAKKLAL